MLASKTLPKSCLQTNTSFLQIPGNASINILVAVKKALAKVQWVSRPPDRVVVKRGLEALKLRHQQLSNLPIHPMRQLTKMPIIHSHELTKDKIRRVRRELVDAGVSLYGLMKSESRYLAKVLHVDEHIEGVIYGQHQSSSAMMVATNERIIYLDKKPMTVLFDEVSYEVVSGIEFDIHMLFATVVLHTPVKNYDFRWVNLHCAEKFARHIEAQRLEHEQTKVRVKPTIAEAPAVVTQQVKVPSAPEFENMAGYGWLPTEEEDRRRIGVGPEVYV